MISNIGRTHRLVIPHTTPARSSRSVSYDERSTRTENTPSPGPKLRGRPSLPDGRRGPSSLSGRARRRGKRRRGGRASQSDTMADWKGWKVDRKVGTCLQSVLVCLCDCRGQDAGGLIARCRPRTTWPCGLSRYDRFASTSMKLCSEKCD
jgi:hypothetical protein